MVPVKFGELVVPSVTDDAANCVPQLPVAVNVTGVPALKVNPLYAQAVELVVVTLTIPQPEPAFTLNFDAVPPSIVPVTVEVEPLVEITLMAERLPNCPLCISGI